MGVFIQARRFRSSILAGLAAVLAGLLMPVAAAAAAKPLGVLGGAGARTVTLRLTDPRRLPPDERASSALLKRQKGKVLYGHLNLVVRNDANEAAALNIGYRSDDQPGVVTLPGHSDVVELESSQASGGSPSRARIGRHSSRELRLVFVLPVDQPPSALDGVLIIKAGKAATGLEIPLAGAAAAIKGVTFEPDSVTLQVTRWQPVGGGDATSTVRLVGSGAQQALRDLQVAGTTSVATELRRDGQHPITVTLADLETDPGDPRAVVGTLTFADHPAPGSYTGTLSLSTFAGSTPTLKLEERSRRWIVWAVLLIFIGALVSGCLTRIYALRRRRKLVQKALADITTEYLEERPDPDDGTDQWSLADVIVDGPPDDQWKSYEALDTSARIAAALRWARNDEDIDEASAAALALAVRVTSWHMIRLLRRDLAVLKELGAGTAGDEWRPNHPWAGTHTALDTAVTLDAARREPADSAAALALADRIRRQVAWHQAFLEAWNLYAQLTVHAFELGKAGDHRRADALTKALEDIDLDTIDSELVGSATRSAEDQAAALYRIGVSTKELLALADEYKMDLVRDTAIEGAGAPNASAATLARSLHTLGQHQAQPQLAFALLGPRPAPTARCRAGEGCRGPGGSGAGPEHIGQLGARIAQDGRLPSDPSTPRGHPGQRHRGGDRLGGLRADRLHRHLGLVRGHRQRAARRGRRQGGRRLGGAPDLPLAAPARRRGRLTAAPTAPAPSSRAWACTCGRRGSPSAASCRGRA